ncbi:MAG: TIGR04423 family type III CRISPR-associated protein [Bacteroidetes bacterium]|nr:MAG: TIGR04423 family type III CRISPR-associated protein [Bacteroidota bacterium]
MQSRHTSIGIKDIPIDLVFHGYLWLSNQQIPEILNGEKVDITLFQTLPFIIEGNLWSEDEQFSIQIKNIDGEYRVSRFDLSHSREDYLLEEKTYIAHDLKGIGEYCVIEAWEEKKDELLEGMKTLVPAWTAFKGFVDPKTK